MTVIYDRQEINTTALNSHKRWVRDSGKTTKTQVFVMIRWLFDNKNWCHRLQGPYIMRGTIYNQGTIIIRVPPHNWQFGGTYLSDQKIYRNHLKLSCYLKIWSFISLSHILKYFRYENALRVKHIARRLWSYAQCFPGNLVSSLTISTISCH